MNTEKSKTSEAKLTSDLQTQFGPLIGGKDLRKALGYKTSQTFRQSLYRGTLPVKVFELEGRRGKFALTADVEKWLSSLTSESFG